ncbi:hypothetical protein [Salmonella phage SD-2_S15]|nr:hypothetical protein [Salmonella phage SD-2_S15]
MISLVESNKSGLERDIMRLIYIPKPSYTNDSTISNETFMYSPGTDSTIVSLLYNSSIPVLITLKKLNSKTIH